MAAKTDGVSIGNIEGGIRDTIIAGGDVAITGASPMDRPQTPPAVPGTAGEHNVGAVRELLTAAFTAQTLRRFCQDRPTFQPVIADFGPDPGLSEMTDRVIDYCGTRLLTGELLAEVKEENPRQYARFEPYL